MYLQNMCVRVCVCVCLFVCVCVHMYKFSLKVSPRRLSGQLLKAHVSFSSAPWRL